MILRDPVHGLVAFEGEAERVVKGLLATREVQRLRRVRQLGLTAVVFPGAEHSRFAHALGAAHVMVRFLERIQAVQHEVSKEQRMSPQVLRDGVAAALLHDIGHGPFSHLFEEVIPKARSHESWSVDIIEDEGSEVGVFLRSIDAEMPSRVAGLIRGKHRLRWLGQAVSGTVDVDRCDYLLRDSHMTGAAYGLYDLDWLQRALTLVERDGEAVLAIQGRKGLPPLEAFFLGRHFMYHQVYHHKATRAAEALIRGGLLRLAELIRDQTIPPGTPRGIRAAVMGEPISVTEYVRLDDPALMHCFAQWETYTDPLLADFSSRLRNRYLPKTLPLPEDAPRELWEKAYRCACAIADELGYRSDLRVFLDVPEDRPYVEAQDPRDQLCVSLSHQPLRSLADVSFLIGQLKGQRVVRPRLVFPNEIRDAVEAEVGRLLNS